MTKQQPNAKYRLDYTPSEFSITDIDLDFNLAPHKTEVTAISQVTKQIDTARTLVLNGEGLYLRAIKINDRTWTDYELTKKALLLHNVPSSFKLTIVNEICPESNTLLTGLYVSGKTLCSQCEAEGFRRITYYLDRPDILAKFTVKLTADKKSYPNLLSNGNRVAQGELENGRHWVKWHDPFPKPCYLFAIVAGDFDVLKDKFVTCSGRSIDLEMYVNKGNQHLVTWAMRCLKNAMRWDETRFGLEYDLDIFMLVAVDFFNMGAMENKGLNIFNAKFVLADPETATDADYLSIESVVGHEYFHNWTGNRVTCRDWFQLSLKEGLTVFRDQEFSSDQGSRPVTRIERVRVIRGPQFMQDASPMSHPIRPDKVIEINNFYTATVYQKGAEVIRMMHTLLGEKRFQAGMRRYFEKHDGTAATCDDFVNAMEHASGIDLTQFKRWYSQSGTPVVRISDDYDARTKRYTLKIRQMTPPTADQKEKSPLHFPLDIELYNNQGEVIALQQDGTKKSSILSITKSEQIEVFDNIPHKPVISLLREFSAPVKLHYDYQQYELIFLLQHATNDFSRYDAVQRLYSQYLLENIAGYGTYKQKISLSSSLIAALRSVLLSDVLDPALVSLLLMPLSENELANQLTIINPDAIHAVRVDLLEALARSLSDEWFMVYETHETPEYRITHDDIGRRALKNTALGYIARSHKREKANQLVSDQYRQADNMTDRFAALAAAVDAQLPCADALLTDFDNNWFKNQLVMDKWFKLQAARPHEDVLTKVKALLSHRSFDINNPNRVNALIGSFINNNPVAFHAKNGQGYQFLVEILTPLNQKNPQLAAKMIDPLLSYKRYDVARQEKMKTALEKLLSFDNLANDLYEKIHIALKG